MFVDISDFGEENAEKQEIALTFSCHCMYVHDVYMYKCGTLKKKNTVELHWALCSQNEWHFLSFQVDVLFHYRTDYVSVWAASFNMIILYAGYSTAQIMKVLCDSDACTFLE